MAPTEGRVAKPEWRWGWRRGTPVRWSDVTSLKLNISAMLLTRKTRSNQVTCSHTHRPTTTSLHCEHCVL